MCNSLIWSCQGCAQFCGKWSTLIVIHTLKTSLNPDIYTRNIFISVRNWANKQTVRYKHNLSSFRIILKTQKDTRAPMRPEFWPEARILAICSKWPENGPNFVIWPKFCFLIGMPGIVNWLAALIKYFSPLQLWLLINVCPVGKEGKPLFHLYQDYKKPSYCKSGKKLQANKMKYINYC